MLLVVRTGIAVSKVHLLLVERSHEMLRLVSLVYTKMLFNKVMNLLSVLGICKELIFK